MDIGIIILTWHVFLNAISNAANFLNPEQVQSQVEVRAVFINCEPDLMLEDYEFKRFQREELFRYSALRNCSRKLALTVKLVNDIDTVSAILTKQDRVSDGNNVFEQSQSESSDTAVFLKKGEKMYQSDVVSLIEESDPYQRNCENNYRESNKETADFVDVNVFQKTVDDHEKSITDYYFNNDQNQHNTHSKVKEWPSNFNIYKHKCLLKRCDHISTKKVNDDANRKFNANVKDISTIVNEDDPERFAGESKPGILGTDSVTTEKEFNRYEIGSSNLWYQVQVQLFEKISTPDGKTVWNDVIKDPFASVSSIAPEWRGQDVFIRYRPSEWISNDEFSLPKRRMCLLTPINCENVDVYDNTYPDHNNNFIVIPAEDITDLDYGNLVEKRDGNSSLSSATEFLNNNEQAPRRVKIRLSSALPNGMNDKLRIGADRSDRYLTIPYRRPLHAQIDLEARAVQNQLVLDGNSGRVDTVVSDSTKPTRTTLSLQVTNTGLVASGFRVATRNCIPEIPNLIKNIEDKSVSLSALVMIAPMHNKHFQVELPIELPCDIINCSVALINVKNDSVAIRDVTIKKRDRCFCIWYCDCICLGDDPKLLCRKMSETRQAAAGLSIRGRLRRARSVYYQDAISINLFVIFIGVLMALLFLGFVKALVGLFIPCIATWGVNRLIGTPRKLERYYERSLRSQQVQYDDVGWPIHPDTKKRTVRFISRPMEFMLNLIFFICVPLLMVCDTCKQLMASFNKLENTNHKKPSKDDSNTKNCFSSHDVQNLESPLRHRRRRGLLQDWMTPHAGELSTNLWQNGLTHKQLDTRPLLHEDSHRGDGTRKSEEMPDCYLDSEQEDMKYILVQMQKSRESLAVR